MTFLNDFLAVVGAWLTGIWVMVTETLDSSVSIFFDGTNITPIGVLALFGLAFGLVMFGVRFVSRLIKK
jgi:hypothetical protein